MKPSRWIFGIILGICVYAIFVLFSDVSLLIEQLENIEIQFIIMGVFVVFVGMSFVGKPDKVISPVNIPVSFPVSINLYPSISPKLVFMVIKLSY